MTTSISSQPPSLPHSVYTYLVTDGTSEGTYHASKAFLTLSDLMYELERILVNNDEPELDPWHQSCFPHINTWQLNLDAHGYAACDYNVYADYIRVFKLPLST